MFKFYFDLKKMMVCLYLNENTEYMITFDDFLDQLYELSQNTSMCDEVIDGCLYNFRHGLKKSHYDETIAVYSEQYRERKLIICFLSFLFEYSQYHNNVFIRRHARVNNYIKKHHISEQLDILKQLLRSFNNKTAIYRLSCDVSPILISYDEYSDISYYSSEFAFNGLLAMYYLLFKSNIFFKCKCIVCGKYFCSKKKTDDCCNSKYCKDNYNEILKLDPIQKVRKVRSELKANVRQKKSEFKREDVPYERQSEFIEYINEKIPYFDNLVSKILCDGASNNDAAFLKKESKLIYAEMNKIKNKIIAEYKAELLREIRK